MPVVALDAAHKLVVEDQVTVCKMNPPGQCVGGTLHQVRARALNPIYIVLRPPRPVQLSEIAYPAAVTKPWRVPCRGAPQPLADAGCVEIVYGGAEQVRMTQSEPRPEVIY